MRKRSLDLLLLALALAGLAYGAYSVGRLVTRESNDLASKSSGETRPASTGAASTGSGKSRIRERMDERNVRIGVAVIAVLVLWILLASLVGTIRRRRRRTRREWRLPR